MTKEIHNGVHRTLTMLNGSEKRQETSQMKSQLVLVETRNASEDRDGFVNLRNIANPFRKFTGFRERENWSSIGFEAILLDLQRLNL